MLICIWFLLYNILSHSYIQLITGCNCGVESLSQPRKSAQPLSENTMTFSSPPPTKRAKVSENGNQNGNANTNVGEDQLQSFMSPPQCCPSLNDKESKKIESLENICFEKSSSSSSNKEDFIRSLLLKQAGYDIDNPSNTKKRQDYMSWDDYFMALSFLSAQRSKDPEEQLGACIVNQDDRIVGIGYNGFPRGCSDDCLPWASKSDEKRELHTKHPFMCHAEMNAILNKCSLDVKGTRMYVAGIPDNVAAKTIIQAGIVEIIYLQDPIENNATRASRIMFEMAEVKLRQYKPATNISPLDFTKCQKSKGTPTCDESSDVTPMDDRKDVEPYQDLLMKEASFNPKNATIKKRRGYLSWDDYFTAVASLSARRSKDPNTQVGACIVDQDKCIIGIGYNGFPRGCSDDFLPWARVADSELHKKYPYVVHAEVNAILNKGSRDVKGASLYVALFPCNECAKVIIQAGIKEVVYLSDVVSSRIWLKFNACSILVQTVLIESVILFWLHLSTTIRTRAGPVELCLKWQG